MARQAYFNENYRPPCGFQMMQRLRQISAKRRWSLGFVALFGFAVAQVTLAAHHFEHDAGDAEVCAACVQLDQFEGAVSPSQAAGATYVPCAIESTTGSDTFRGRAAARLR